MGLAGWWNLIPTTPTAGPLCPIWFNLWSKVPEFSSFLPQGKQEDFKTTILEGMETAKHQVRVVFDACQLVTGAARLGSDACKCARVLLFRT